MGYFNIFYKLTRIIDFFTRKRNRKFIVILLILIAVLFIFHNKVNAQEDNLQYNQTFTHSHIRLNSDGTVQYGTINTSNLYYSIIFPVKEGFTYKGACTSAPADAPLKVGFVSELDNMIYTYTSIENATYVNYGPGAVSILGVYNSTTGFEITADSDGYFIIGGFRPSGSAIGYQDCGFQVYTDYNGESNLNTINQDLLRIEELLKDYLYGDKELYNIAYNSISGLYIQPNNYIISSNAQAKIISFKVRKNQTYNISFNSTASWNYDVSYCFNGSYITPIVNLDMNSYKVNNIRIPSNSNEYIYTINAENDGYVYLSFGPQITLNTITSNYNEGQENGLYGGLTDINDQTRLQGEQTRDTITDTSIPTNEMTIDTSIVDSVSNEENDNFLISIINKFQNVITPSSSVTTITIPIPKTGKNIVLRSDLLSSHISNTIIGTYITVFWYVVFFIYFFKFAYRVINWVVTGEIIEKPSGFMKYLMEQNAIITASMM